MRRLTLVVLLLCVPVLAGCGLGAVASVDNDEFGTCVAVPHGKCADGNLFDAALTNADLRGIDLSGADLRGADLTGANLDNANLQKASLVATNFTNASLRNADLRGANLTYATLLGADLDGANTTGALKCATLNNAGLFELGSCAAAFATNVAKGVSKPARIDWFVPTKPIRCENDVVGTSIEVDYRATGSINLIRLDGVSVFSGGAKRATLVVPFVCDGRPHTLSLESFGDVGAVAKSSFSLALEPSEPRVLR